MRLLWPKLPFLKKPLGLDFPLMQKLWKVQRWMLFQRPLQAFQRAAVAHPDLDGPGCVAQQGIQFVEADLHQGTASDPCRPSGLGRGQQNNAIHVSQRRG
ncbi:MAG: hypothetical protein VKI83_00330 [Synechococcaceae cyanobacterium]|nr:hypothetical protein [Synechococcaceae cyanobacterium]